MESMRKSLLFLFILIAVCHSMCWGLEIKIDTTCIRTDIDPDGRIIPLYQGITDFWWDFFEYGHHDPENPDDEQGVIAENYLKDINLKFYRINLPLCKIYSSRDWLNLRLQYTEASDWLYNDRIAKGKSIGEEITTAETVEEAENPDLYNWQNADNVFASIEALGVEPLIQITKVPTSIRPLFNSLGNPVGDRIETYAAIIKHVIMHYTQGWPDGTGHYYELKYFEIWNEPNHLGDSYLRVDQYFTLYKAVAGAIKEVDPDFLVGGPALASTVGWKTWLGGNSLNQGFLDLCQTGGYDDCPLDFLSIHGYSDNPQFFKTLGRDVKIIITNSGYGSDDLLPPMILSEWGSVQSLLSYGFPSWERSKLETNWAAIHAVKSLLNMRSGGFEYATYWMSTDARFQYTGTLNGDDFNVGGMGLLRSWQNPDVGLEAPYENKRKKLYYAFKVMDLLNDTSTEIDIQTDSTEFFESTNLVEIAGKNPDTTTITAVIVNSAEVLGNTLENLTVNGLKEGDQWTIKIMSLNDDEDLAEIAATPSPAEVPSDGNLDINNWSIWLPERSVTVIRLEKQ